MSGDKVLLKGNEAIAEAAVRAGCTAYFGYPITPQNELIAYMSSRLPELNRVFIQAESETAAINMVYGVAATGRRTMTSSSSPGISLKQEGISYAAGADLPMVIVNVSRSGPGLGGIAPAQGDYFQSTRGGGHGDYYTIVLAPFSVQEAADLTYLAFDLADKWRIPVLVLADGVIGQMMEGVELPPMRELDSLPDHSSWAVGNMGAANREPHRVSSLDLVPEKLEVKVLKRYQRYEQLKAEEPRCELTDCDDAELILVAYGTAARVSLGAVRMARQAGLKVGLCRPITLWPFPDKTLSDLADRGLPFLSVEMSMGQMVQDIRLAVRDRVPVHLLSRCGGMVPTEEEVFAKISAVLEDK